MHYQTIKKDLKKLKKKPNLVDYEKTYKDFSWEEAEKKEIEFFSDGTLNMAYNAIDKHAKGKKKNKTALIFHKVNDEKETYTFADMARETNKFANVLVDQGVAKEDRVFLFLPTIPERYIAFLGVLKTGAIAGTMFSA